MLRKLSVAELSKEAKFAGLAEETLSGIIAGHLLNWAEIFHLIRRDLVELNSNGRVSTMNLKGSSPESLSESSGCDYCGGCCEIRAGPAEFTDAFEPPERWFLYFRGDGCSHQRFCPFWLSIVPPANSSVLFIESSRSAAGPSIVKSANFFK
jgi:hypothetical protein